jgi:glycosyltransferase involved in cell wall biosynthesis
MSPKQMPKQHSLCIAVLSLNEASTITNCLHSAQFADQLLVIDAGSTDSTVNLAQSLGAEIHHHDDWQGFAAQRNRALDHCHCEYIFFLDCDEVIPAELAKEISIAVTQGAINRGLIRWDEYVFGRRLHGIHQTKGIARLFKVCDLVGFEGQVHESAILKAPPQAHLFRTRLIHHSRRSIHQSLLKLTQYSQLAAIKLRHTRHRSGVAIGLLHALPRFLNLYLVKLSFLSGAEGFLYSLFITLEVFFKYCAAYYDSDPEASTPARR